MTSISNPIPYSKVSRTNPTALCPQYPPCPVGCSPTPSLPPRKPNHPRERLNTVTVLSRSNSVFSPPLFSVPVVVVQEPCCNTPPAEHDDSAEYGHHHPLNTALKVPHHTFDPPPRDHRAIPPPQYIARSRSYRGDTADTYAHQSTTRACTVNIPPYRPADILVSMAVARHSTTHPASRGSMRNITPRGGCVVPGLLIEYTC